MYYDSKYETYIKMYDCFKPDLFLDSSAIMNQCQ